MSHSRLMVGASARGTGRDRMYNPEDQVAGVKAKLRRTTQVIDEITSMGKSLLHDRGPAVTVERERSDDRLLERFRARIDRQPPPEFGVLVGDAVHNLRSALDHIVFGLAVAGGGKYPPEGKHRLQYPIELKQRAFEDAEPDRLRNVSVPAVEWIESSQPYHHVYRPITVDPGSDLEVAAPPEHHPLALLRDLSNQDKHRNVAAAAVLSLGPIWWPSWDADTAPEFTPLGGGPIEDGQVIGTYRYEDADSPDVRVEFAFDVGLPSEVATDWPIWIHLGTLQGFIEHDVLAALEPHMLLTGDSRTGKDDKSLTGETGANRG